MFVVGGSHDNEAAPICSSITVIENGASLALALPSLTVMTMFEYVPALALVGVPESCPVAELKEIHAGRFAIENVTVSAYLGVVPLVRIPQVQTAIASIASVQARHAAYVGTLNGQSPAPSPADTPRSREEILALLDPYIGQCTTPQ